MSSFAELTEKFDKATNYVLSHGENMEQNTLLTLYGFYKQATVGSCNTPKPSWFDFNAKLKWKAWNNCCGLSKTEAMNEYIKKLNAIDENWYKSEMSISGVSVSSMCSTDQLLTEDQKTIYDWIKEGDMEKLKTKHFDPNCKDDQGLAPLHWAADRGDLPIVQYLVEVKKANVDCLDNEKQTPLHYAAACGYPAIVEYLIKAGANSNITDNDNNTPKDVAENDTVLALFP